MYKTSVCKSPWLTPPKSSNSSANSAFTLALIVIANLLNGSTVKVNLSEIRLPARSWISTKSLSTKSLSCSFVIVATFTSPIVWRCSKVSVKVKLPRPSKLKYLDGLKVDFQSYKLSCFARSLKSLQVLPPSMDTCFPRSFLSLGLPTVGSVGRIILTLEILESLACLNWSKLKWGLTLIFVWFGITSISRSLIYFSSVFALTFFKFTSLIIISRCASSSVWISSNSSANSGLSVAITSTLSPLTFVEKLNLDVISRPFWSTLTILEISRLGNCTSAKWSVKINCSKLLNLGNWKSVFHV